MALNDKIKAAKPAVEGETKVTTPKEVGEAVGNTMVAPTAQDGIVYGTARGDLEFMNPLGDPSDDDTTRIKGEDGSESKTVTPSIVGYAFKVLKDMQIPDCGTTDEFKGSAMNFVNKDNWIPVKAGTTVYLTPFETAYLLSQPQFNGGCEGGSKEVACVYALSTKKTANGDLVKASSIDVPRVNLRAVAGSIKDFDFINVLECKKVVGANGQARKERVLNPGFEKWAPYAKTMARKASSNRASSNKSDDKNAPNAKAASFLAFINNRK